MPLWPRGRTGAWVPRARNFSVPIWVTSLRRGESILLPWRSLMKDALHEEEDHPLGLGLNTVGVGRGRGDGRLEEVMESKGTETAGGTLQHLTSANGREHGGGVLKAVDEGVGGEQAVAEFLPAGGFEGGGHPRRLEQRGDLL
ncbi:MAG: hypothetical protein RLZ70_2041 [Verrucomicrobiota bacterium]